ncbi:vang-like protein 2 [Limulus polyphemus]|uniref:Vang-like protein 2 n=1 Tax=Limulus polyphemus TaxID=6850 RepID=A0ABM1B982_LIMPO|nr:vang-like protein 2 [Limulus polyphemus]
MSGSMTIVSYGKRVALCRKKEIQVTTPNKRSNMPSILGHMKQNYIGIFAVSTAGNRIPYFNAVNPIGASFYFPSSNAALFKGTQPAFVVTIKLMSFWPGDNFVGSGIQLQTYRVTTENESVKSRHSVYSTRFLCSQGHRVASFNNSNHRSRLRHSHRSKTTDHSVPVISGNKTSDRMGQTRSCDDVIEVQILPQDQNWGDNTTAITGNSSDHSISMENLYRLGRDSDESWIFKCQMWMGSFVATILSIFAFLSPLVMVVLPKLDVLEWKVQKCGPECDGLLISFAFKLVILLCGTWAVFFRRPKATMPRIFIFRALVLVLIVVFTFSYWLFYSVRIVEKQKNEHEVSYHSIVLFAVSLVDALLFIHYLAVILIEIRHLQPQYFVKVVRSPDGESHCYSMGQLSIQRAAVWVLERYYQDFSPYNPYLDTLPTKSYKGKSSLKFSDIDGMTKSDHSSVLPSGYGRRRGTSHNERFYEECEYERRVKKRKARLITAVEEAFTHIKRLREETGPAIPMDSAEAAQAIFPSMARALQKYLRITRQQPRHSMQAILEHLALCLSHDLSPRTFLEKYITVSPVLQNDKEHTSMQKWALVCDTLLSRAVEPGCIFLLRQNDVSVLVIVHQLPHFNITEEIIDPKTNKFALRLNSETSV